MELGKPNLDAFAEAIHDLARHDSSVLVVTSDSRGSGKLGPFGKEFPKQIIEVGIAEQNLVGVAAGLASTGKTVFAVSPACFLTARALEQIKNDVCYSDNPVKVVGISGGVSYGALGSTHHSLHDYAVLRAINNIIVVAPADNFETREAVIAGAKLKSPVYLRFGKKPMPHLPGVGQQFELGKARRVREGSDVVFVASGETVVEAFQAAELLAQENISAGVLSVHTIKPLDTSAILDVASTAHAVVTVEEHSVNGGLGEACASLLLQHGSRPRFKIVGVPDEYTVTGSQTDIFRYYGISPSGLLETVRTLLS
ncbi:MAG: transketolase family protein [Verrucomicrobia bacterium]|nr:transketolase family protein [Verrucomicrobiota bacterium]